MKTPLIPVLTLFANLTIFAAIFAWSEYARNSLAFISLAGMGIGYTCLVFFFLAFGGMRGPWRHILCTTLAACIGVAMNWRQLDNALIPTLTVVSLGWLCYAALVIPRYFLDWRIETGNRARMQEEPNRGKYTLKSILAFMFIVSIPLGLIQVMISIDARRTLGELTAFPFIMAVGMATVLPATIAAFARVGARWKIIASAAWCLTGTLLLATVGPAWFPYVTLFHFACWACVLPNLLAGRAMGLRWHVPQMVTLHRNPTSLNYDGETRQQPIGILE